MPLKVATFTNGKFLRFCALRDFTPRPGCPKPGIAAEVIAAMFAFLNIPYELVPFEDDSFGTFKNGTFQDGLFKLLESGSVDLIANLFVRTDLRARVFEFSFPINEERIIFVTKTEAQELMANAWLILKVFKPSVWFALLGFALTVGAALLAIRLRHFTLTRLLDLGYRTTKLDALGLRILLTSFGLVAILFVNLYQSGLLAHLLHPPLTFAFTDPYVMLELIRKGQLTLLLDSFDWYQESVIHSQHPFFTDLRRVTEGNSIELEPDFGKLIEKLKTGKYAHPTLSDSIYEFRIASCKLYGITGPELPAVQYSLMFKKNSSLTALFNRAVVALQNFNQNIGLKYVNKNKLRAHQLCQQSTNANGKPLNFLSLSGVFWTFFTSCFVASILFTLEHLRMTWKVKKVAISRSPSDKATQTE